MYFRFFSYKGFSQKMLGDPTFWKIAPIAEKKFVFTFLGEKIPTVTPSSLRATPISAKTASLCNRIASVLFNFSSQVSFNSF